MLTFEELISEAEEHKFSGWDFSFLNGRWKEESVPWDYKEIVENAAIDTSRMLDIGTWRYAYRSSNKQDSQLASKVKDSPLRHSMTLEQ